MYTRKIRDKKQRIKKRKKETSDVLKVLIWNVQDAERKKRKKKD